MVVACPVVALYPRRSELILYGGAVHLSKEQMPHAGGGAEYGRVVLFDAQGWGEPLDGVWLRSLSQEHGIIAAEPAAFARLASTVSVGDLVGVGPVHSCLAADLLKRYRTVDGRWLEMMRGW
jgi:D-serine deaminase-like pyridoxal phosphate-dependent protein